VGSSWSAFSPDDSRIVTATTGTMTVRDVATGQPVGDSGVISLPSGVTGSMPDWSPDGHRLAFAATPMAPPNASYSRHLYGSSIAVLAAQGDGFSGYQVVAPSTGNDCQPILAGGAPQPAYAAGARETYANPMFSPDGQWLVFSHADCESEGDPTAELVVAPVSPNAPQNHLVRANSQVGAAQVSNVTNGMPVWGPTNDPHLAWVAFTSTRDYGLVLTPGSKIGSTLSPPFPGSNVRQLWIAAIDLSKLSSGDVSIDPSYPAFRFSAQDLTENNHRPFWTVDTIPQVNPNPPLQ
jgi:Tol biopolymer transport system component